MATIHASALIVGAAGILIRGRSGSGKSRLTAMLLARASEQGRFAGLVADDRVCVASRAGRLIASAPAAIAGTMEIRGFGVVRTEHMPAAVLRLVIDLEDACAPRLPGAEHLTALVEGVCLPRLPAPSPERALECAPAALAAALSRGSGVLPLAFATQHANVTTLTPKRDALICEQSAC